MSNMQFLIAQICIAVGAVLIAPTGNIWIAIGIFLLGFAALLCACWIIQELKE